MAYGFDADRLMVWLVKCEPDADRLRAGALCRRHADRLVVPRGWTLDDRRESIPRLFPVPDLVAEPTDERATLPWTGEFDVSDDLGGVLAANSPLLSRAFRGTSRRQ
jgi:hypothetical protein